MQRQGGFARLLLIYRTKLAGPSVAVKKVCRQDKDTGRGSWMFWQARTVIHVVAVAAPQPGGNLLPE